MKQIAIKELRTRCSTAWFKANTPFEVISDGEVIGIFQDVAPPKPASVQDVAPAINTTFTMCDNVSMKQITIRQLRREASEAKIRDWTPCNIVADNKVIAQLVTQAHQTVAVWRPAP